MQTIINKILAGELNQKQLVEALVDYNDKTIAEYDEACDVVDNNQLQINKLEATARQREDNIKTIEKNALVAVDYARKLESDNARLMAGNKELKALKAENKKLKAQTKRQAEANKKAITRNESLTKEYKRLNKEVAVHKSDIARLRLTGHKEIGKYAFSIFPCKISDESNIKKVVLIASDKSGNMKCVTVDNGEVVQPRSHNFKFDAEQESFIRDFDSIAEADGYQFTDRVLSLIN